MIRWRYIISITGILAIFLSVAMLFPLLYGFFIQDQSVQPLAYSALITFGGGVFLYRFFYIPHSNYLSHREGVAIVSFGWITIGFFGALPFYFGFENCTIVDAVFESVSGFTTTGASVLNDIEALPKGLLLWRSLIQWLGGMGIIVLSIAILPFLGVGGMQLYKAEIPSPVPDKLRPRIRDTAMVLWKVYVLLSLMQIFFLTLGGMNYFDSLCHTFTTMPTGGFSTKNASIGYFQSPYIETVIAVFMILAGINFSLHFLLLSGKISSFYKDSEVRFYFFLLTGLIACITLDVWKTVYPDLSDAFRYAFFQVASIMTTTGYATADYESWPATSQMILLLCMFIGACAGSTGGGIKCLRIFLYLKYCYKELFSLIHPHAVRHVKIGGNSVPEDVMRSVLGFIGLYIGLFATCSVLLAATGVDLLTAISATASAIGNIGPGLGSVGPAENYSHLPFLGKWILIWCMLIGRLEIYTLLILVLPEFWRK